MRLVDQGDFGRTAQTWNAAFNFLTEIRIQTSKQGGLTCEGGCRRWWDEMRGIHYLRFRLSHAGPSLPISQTHLSIFNRHSDSAKFVSLGSHEYFCIVKLLHYIIKMKNYKPIPWNFSDGIFQTLRLKFSISASQSLVPRVPLHHKQRERGEVHNQLFDLFNPPKLYLASPEYWVLAIAIFSVGIFLCDESLH